MQRHLHPTYDREWLLRMAAMAGALALSLGFGAVGTWLGGMSVWGVALGFVIFLGLAWRWGPGINSCVCPSCWRRLRRPSDTTDFVCEDCRTVWWTRGTGYYWLD
jgi:hypothetical protein